MTRAAYEVFQPKRIHDRIWLLFARNSALWYLCNMIGCHSIKFARRSPDNLAPILPQA